MARPPWRQTSLRTRLLIIVLAGVLPVLAVAGINACELQRDSEAKALSILRQDLDFLSKQQFLVTENTRLFLSTISKMEAARRPDPKALVPLFQDLMVENPLYVALSAFDAEGEFLAAHTESGPISIKDRAYYKTLIKSLNFTIGGYAISRTTGKQTLHFAHPAFDPDTGALACVLVASYDLAYYGTLFRIENQHPQSVVEVFDRSGIRLFRHPMDDEHRIGEIGGKDAQDLIVGHDKAHGKESMLDAREIVASNCLNFDFSPEADLLVLIRYPRSFMRRLSTPVVMRSLLMILASLLISFILLQILTHYGLALHVDGLLAAAQRYGSGELGQAPGISGGGLELQTLARALEKMAQGIMARGLERDAAEGALRKSLEEKELLLKEIHHRVKNNFQVISSLLNLQSESIQDPEAAQAFMESQNRIKSMALIHERLYQSESLERIDFSDYVNSMAGEISSSFAASAERIRIETELERVELSIDAAIPLGLIVNELITNAYKYAFPNKARGRILVRLKEVGNSVLRLTVSDDGVGMPQAVDAHQGLGFVLVEALVAQLKGRYWVDVGGEIHEGEESCGRGKEVIGQGTSFNVEFSIRGPLGAPQSTVTALEP